MGRHVRPLGEELVILRRPFGVGQIGRDLPAGRRVPQGAQRIAVRREVARRGHEARHQRVAQGLDADRLQPAAKAQLAPVCGVLFIGKKSLLGGSAVRGKGLGPIGRETVVFGLNADHAVQLAEAGMARLQPEVAALVSEHRSRVGPFEFGVPVVGMAKLAFEALDDSAQIAHLAFQRHAVGLHVNRHIVLGHRAVVAAVGADRGAQATLVKKHRPPRRTALDLAGRVADAVAQGRHSALVAGQLDRRIHIIGLAVEHVDMQRMAVVAAFKQHATAFLAISRRQTQIDLAADAAFFVKQRLARNPVVDHVDDAAHRAAAVQQGTGAAQHLDALDADRVGRDRVVIAQAGSIERGAAVAQDADAVAIEAADDGPAGVRSKVGAAHARHAVECFAQRGFGAQ